MAEDNPNENISFIGQRAQLDATIAELKGKLAKKNKSRMITAILLVAVLITIALHVASVIRVNIFILVFLSFFSFILFVASVGIDCNDIIVEIDKNEAYKRNFFSFLDAEKNQSYFEKLVKINIENLSDYYILTKESARQSFRLSFVVSCVGFGLVVLGIIGGYADSSLRDISYMSAGAG